MNKELIHITKKLISFQTTQDKEEIKKCFNFIKKEMKGFKIKEYNINGKRSLVIFLGRDRKKFDIILNGHIDVVPAEKNEFKPKIKNGKIYGRGSYDMKSGCAIGILLMKKLRPKNVALILTSDEEIGGENGTGFLVKKGYRAKFVIVLEGTKEKVVAERKGVLRLSITAKGKSVHASKPWDGINAIEKLINCYLDIKKTFPKITKKSSYEKKWQRTINLGVIRGGDVVNKVPDYAEMGIDIRFNRKENPKKILNKIKLISRKHKCSVKIDHISPITFTDIKNIYVKKILESSKLKIKKQLGASDSRFFSEKGMPVVDIGPKGKNVHAKGEFVYIKSMEKIYKILEKFISELKS